MNHLVQYKPMLSLWRRHCLSDGNLPITTKRPQNPVWLKNLTKLRGCWLKKGFVCLYLLVFCSCVSIVGIPVNSPSVQFMHGILSTLWCRQKQQSALKIGKNWRVLNQPAGLRWAFLFYKHDCCNFDVPIILSQCVLTIFHQDVLFTAQTETSHLLGPEWSVLVLVSGGCMFSSQLKVAMMLPSQSMRMPWGHNNQPVIVIVINIYKYNLNIMQELLLPLHIPKHDYLGHTLFVLIWDFAPKMS